MAQEWLGRAAAVLGEAGLEKLAGARVALVGLGGVGGAAAEALARSGVGSILLVDGDRVEPGNLNRQLLATCQTVGMPKTLAAARRLWAVNPALCLQLYQGFCLPGAEDFLFDYRPDLVLDAIDMLTAKISLAAQCRQRGIAFVACLGTGNRVDPTQVRVGRLSQTAGCGCPLARRMRAAWRRQQLPGDPWVVYSAEQPVKALAGAADAPRRSPGSTAFVPNAAGLALAFAGVRLLLEGGGQDA